MWLPTNDDTKTIQYDCKFLKSSPGRYPALKWSVTKIEDTAIEGVSMFTMAQTQFDPAKDNVDLMIADYWESAVEPELPELEEIPTIFDLEITYSGKPAVRAGGGYKKFTAKIRTDGKLDDVSEGVKWSINDELVDIIDNSEWSINFGDKEGKLICFGKNNILKVKCTDDYSLIGKTFTITAESEYSSKSLIVEVTSL